MPKIKRNAPCPCGSGRKHKKCCSKGPTPWQRKMWAKLVERFLTGE